ncbi:MAG: response regulator [Desulfobacteraceae bacterium]|nr:MAG: response regulator [Desulfobacteraceae bacterium]
MRIRTKTLAIVGTMVMTLVTVLTAASYLLVTGRFARLEIDEVETQVLRVHNELNDTIATLEAIAADWAPWDNTCRFIQDLNESYVEENLVDATFTNLRLNFMLFFNNNAELAYSRFFELNPDLPPLDPEAILAEIGRYPALLRHTAAKSRVSGVLVARGFPFLVTAHPIVTSKFELPIRGTLLLGRALDSEEIKRIAAVTKSNLAIHRIAHPQLKVPAATVLSALSETGKIRAEPISAQLIGGYGTISDLNGDPALIIEITRDRNVYQYGLATWRQNAVTMFASSLFFFLLIVLLLDRSILNRLRDMALRVNALASSVDASGRLEIRNFDEIGQLAQSINTMLESLHRYHSMQIASEKRYRQFFEEDITGDFLMSLDGRIIECNQAFARIFGYASAEEVKSADKERFYPSKPNGKQLLRGLLREGRTEGIELELTHRSGRPIYCIGNLVGHLDDSGALKEIGGYLFDDTKRVLLEKDLRQAQKMESIGTLAGGIAHDFNNILSGIMGYTEIALSEIPAAAPAAGRLQRVIKAAHRAKELVHQILTFSRQDESNSRPLQLVPVVEEAVKLMRAGLPSTIAIRVRAQAQVTIMADPVQIHQVIMNLCTNAGQAMKKKGGILTVIVEETTLDESFTDRYIGVAPGHFARISVADTGEGIAPEIMDRIFDPFFTTKGKTEGTGLGLSVVHGIVTRLNGAITVTSSAGGSRFDVYLPCSGQPCETKTPESQPIPRGKESIVLIDDEDFQVEIGTQMLMMLGYRVVGFTDSIKALEYISAHADQVDLVITDMTMPKLTGIDLTRRLLDQKPLLPIILCTGYSEAVSAETASSTGVRGFIMKPIVVKDLAGKVREVLDAGTR